MYWADEEDTYLGLSQYFGTPNAAVLLLVSLQEHLEHLTKRGGSQNKKAPKQAGAWAKHGTFIRRETAKSWSPSGGLL